MDKQKDNIPTRDIKACIVSPDTGPVMRILRTFLFPFRVFSNLYSPIFVKEMRGAFRRRRFFLTHTVCLSAASIAILLGVFYWSIEKRGGMSPADVGEKLFNMFVVIQFLIIYSVFPAFGCTSITEERVGKSFDLLLTSNLQPWELVFGKFLSCFVYSSVFIFATIPLVCISFLFGGVTITRIADTYAILIVFSFMITVFSIFVSSVATTSSKSVIATYGILAVAAVVGYFALGFLADQLVAGTPAAAIAGSGEEKVSLLEKLQTAFRESTLDSTNRLFLFLYVFYLFAGFLALFFILASNRLKPPSYNRSTSLKILLAAFALVLVVTMAFHYSYNESMLVPTDELIAGKSNAPEGSAAAEAKGDDGELDVDEEEDTSGSGPLKKKEKESAGQGRVYKPKFTDEEKVGWTNVIYTIAALLAIVAVIIFAGEDRRPSLRIQHRLAAHYRGWKFPLRIFAPGAPAGAVFAVTFTALLFGLLTLFFLAAGGIAGIDWPGEPPIYRGFYSLFYFSAAWIAFIFFMAVLSVYLSTTRLSLLAARVAVVVILALLAILPLILCTFSITSTFYTAYYASPILFSINAWHLPKPLEEGMVHLNAFGLPIHAVAVIFYSLLGAAVLALTVRRIDRQGGRFPLEIAESGAMGNRRKKY